MKRARFSVIFTVVIAWLVVLLPAISVADNDVSFTASLDGKTENGNVETYIFIAADKETATYNAFWMTLTYDDTALEFVGAEENGRESNAIRHLDASAQNGLLKIAGCGDSITQNAGAIVLKFKPIAKTVSEIRLTSAQISACSELQSDARPATLNEASIAYTVASGYYTVELPSDKGVYGDASVAIGGDYTFRTDPHYSYTFSVKMGTEETTVTDNGNGIYTIKNVTAPLVFSDVSRTPKSYSVSVTGSGKDDVSANDAATYNEAFTFTLSKLPYAEYSVSVFVDGIQVTPSIQNNTYTVAAADVTGAVTISVAKVTAQGTTLVLFVGNGADAVLYGTEQTCKTGEPFSFTLTASEGDEYTVTVNGQVLTPSYGIYTIPAEMVTSSFLTVTVTKLTQVDMTVTVSGYLSGRLQLVRANVTLPIGKTLHYNGKAMYYSSSHGAYLYVVSGVVNESAARQAITVETGTVEVLTMNGDVNGSAKMDINDAQMVYDMCVDIYEFTELPQIMWLRADVNLDGHINVQDSQRLLYLLVK